MKSVSVRIMAGLLLLALSAWVGVKVFVGAVNFPLGSTTVAEENLAGALRLPPGYAYTVYADDVPNARELRLTHSGDLLVANPNRDRIVLLKKDNNNDGKHDGQRVILENLHSPNGMDFYTEGQTSWLYVAEEDAIGRVAFDHHQGTIAGEYERIVKNLPGGGNHWKKSLRFGPDGRMYVTMGSSCNVCEETDRRRATMMRYYPDGSGEEIYASGLRNSEGFDWNGAGELYATDNGRDLLGDDFPPCELNRIEAGGFYGWPYANGDRLVDPDYGRGHESEIQRSLPPAHGFRAHNAPLGIAFLHHATHPVEYRGAALVALHGSWNRSVKDGYKVVSLHWDSRGAIVEKDFMTGFLHGDTARGRPAEIIESAEGDIYISDDYAGAIYRVRYTGVP